MARPIVHLGPRGNGGIEAEVVRAYNDDNADYYHSFLTYKLHGVGSITADKPEAVGYADHTLISVEFVNGATTQFMGQIVGVDT